MATRLYTRRSVTRGCHVTAQLSLLWDTPKQAWAQSNTQAYPDASISRCIVDCRLLSLKPVHWVIPAGFFRDQDEPTKALLRQTLARLLVAGSPVQFQEPSPKANLASSIIGSLAAPKAVLTQSLKTTK